MVLAIIAKWLLLQLTFKQWVGWEKNIMKLLEADIKCNEQIQPHLKVMAL